MAVQRRAFAILSLDIVGQEGKLEHLEHLFRQVTCVS